MVSLRPDGPSRFVGDSSLQLNKGRKGTGTNSAAFISEKVANRSPKTTGQEGWKVRVFTAVAAVEMQRFRVSMHKGSDTHTMRGNDAVRQKQKISRKETRDSIPSAATFNLAAIRMCEMCISEGKQDIAMAKMIAMKDNIRMHDSYRILDQCMHLLDCKKRRKDSKWISMHTDVGTHNAR